MALTVGELIKQLQEHNADATVDIEGCDCFGQAAGVEAFGDSVLITR